MNCRLLRFARNFDFAHAKATNLKSVTFILNRHYFVFAKISDIWDNIVMREERMKPVVWVGNSKKRLKEFPEDVNYRFARRLAGFDTLRWFRYVVSIPFTEKPTQPGAFVPTQPGASTQVAGLTAGRNRFCTGKGPVGTDPPQRQAHAGIFRCE